jgi:hypothetical protein
MRVLWTLGVLGFWDKSGKNQANYAENPLRPCVEWVEKSGPPEVNNRYKERRAGVPPGGWIAES